MGDGADYFVRKYIEELLRKDSRIDTVILGCTHYPLLLPKIRQYMPAGIRVVPQGGLVAESLKDYLRRHPEIEAACAKHGTCRYLTTENSDKFNDSARIFMHEPVHAETIFLADELSADKFSADE